MAVLLGMWRVRGWQKNSVADGMKVNVQVCDESTGALYVDSLDMYHARQRQGYASSVVGKSSRMDAVLGLMPEEERIQYSAMTGQSLYYLGETSLWHKILAIAEEEGVRQVATGYQPQSTSAVRGTEWR